jgi:hypothetical protein
VHVITGTPAVTNASACAGGGNGGNGAIAAAGGNANDVIQHLSCRVVLTSRRLAVLHLSSQT